MRSNFRKTIVGAGLLLAPPLGLFAWAAAPDPGSTVSVNYGDPTTSGTSTTSFTIQYEDSVGAQQTINISVPVSVTPADTPTTKRTKIQSAVNEALENNQVGGAPLASTSGSAEHLAISPAADTAAASNVKIKNLKAKDDHTGENDKVWDGTSSHSLAILSITGSITGSNGSGGSTITVETNAGSTTINLSGGTRAIDLMQDLIDGLRADGEAIAWPSLNEGRIYVLVDKTDITYAAIASNDTGLSVSCMLLSSE